MDDEHNDSNEQTVEQSFLIDQSTSGDLHAKDQNLSSTNSDETSETMGNSSTMMMDCEKNDTNEHLISFSAVTNTMNADCKYFIFSTQLFVP